MRDREDEHEQRAAEPYVLAYGSNLFIERMMGRCPSARVIGLASLAGHQLRFHMRSTDGSGKADAFRTGDRSDAVKGVVYQLGEQDLSVLDGYESGYVRELHPLRVRNGEGEMSVEAWVYHSRPERVDPRLSPFTWYHRFVVEGARRHGIARAYVRAIERIEAVVDRREELREHRRAPAWREAVTAAE